MANPIYKNPSTVMAIIHDLPMLGSNELINKRIIAKYPTMSYIYDDDELNHIILQNIADEWRDHAAKLYETTLYDYNPIENYRMIETSENTSKSQRGVHACDKTSAQSTADGTTTSDGKAESVSDNSAYGYNSDKPTSTGKTENGSTTSANVRNGSINKSNGEARRCEQTEQTDNGTSRLERSGNIGVTTSQQMIQSERDIIIDVLDWYVEKFISGFIWGGI